MMKLYIYNSIIKLYRSKSIKIIAGPGHTLVLDENEKLRQSRQSRADFVSLRADEVNLRADFVSLRAGLVRVPRIREANIALGATTNLYACENNYFGEIGLGDNKNRNT